MNSQCAALILAAGANTRLGSILPPGMKPLILINGKTLFRHAIDHAQGVWNVERIIAVVSPDNARPLSLIGGADDWVVQPTPVDIIDALQRGLRAIDANEYPWTLVLCADNTFDLDEQAMSVIQFNAGKTPMFGARNLPFEDEQRFTRYVGCQPSGIATGVTFVPRDFTGNTQGCWIGPLYLPTSGLKAALQLNDITAVVNAAKKGRALIPVPMHCMDMGIPEAL